jgi:hypothetical protein
LERCLFNSEGDALHTVPLLLLKHQQRRVALSVAIGVRQHRSGDQPVAVLDQFVAQMTQLRLLAVALLVQLRIDVVGRLVRLVRSLLAAKIVSVAGTVFTAKALLRGPRLNHSVPAAVKCSSLIKSLRLHVNFGKEPGRYIAGQQPVSVLREYRVVPHRVIHAQTHEPPKQQVVVDLLNQQPFRTNQAENPQKQGPQTVLWRSRKPRPEFAYSASNSGLSAPGTPSISLRTARRADEPPCSLVAKPQLFRQVPIDRFK